MGFHRRMQVSSSRDDWGILCVSCRRTLNLMLTGQPSSLVFLIGMTFDLSLAIGLVAVAGTTAFTPTTDENMNGEYVVSKTPNAPGNFTTNFKDYPGTIAEQATQWQANSPTLRST